ncbi:hypothetical protein F2Q70_00044159, partial [Brassica cretica]
LISQYEGAIHEAPRGESVWDTFVPVEELDIHFIGGSVDPPTYKVAPPLICPKVSRFVY